MPSDTERPPVYRRPNVLPICLAAFFNDMGSDMLFAFYPLFLVLILNIQDMKVLGGIESIALLIGLLIRPVSGFVADRKGRRHFIWVGYILLLLSRVGQALAQVWWHLVPPKALYELGQGVRNPPREALLAESVPKNERGLVFGLLQSMDTAGAVLGPLLGLALFYLFVNARISTQWCYRWVILCSAVPTLASVFLTAFFTRETIVPGAEPPKPAPKPDAPTRAAAILKEHKTLLLFTVVSALFAVWAATENFMLVCALKILGLSRASAQNIGTMIVLYLAINITFAPTALWSGKCSDRRGRRGPVLAGFIVMAILCFGFAFVRAYGAILVCFALHGIHQGLLKPSEKAFVADLAPSHLRATALGAYSTVTSIAGIPASLLFGLVWDWTGGWKVPFLISGCSAALCALLLALFVKEHRDILPVDAKAQKQ